MLADTEVEAFNARGVALPAAGRSHLLDGLEGAEHHAVAPLHQAPAAYGLDDLRLQERRQGHPAGLGGWPGGLAAGQGHPLPEVGEERGGVLLEAVGQAEGHTAGRQHLDDLVDHALRHGQRPVPDVNGPQQLGDRIDRRPHPMG